MSASLLELVQGLIVRTYRVRAEMPRIGEFLIGDAGYRRLYAAGAQVACSPGTRGARTLVRETEGGLRACIYYPDRLIRVLERYPPQHGVHNHNVDAFSTLVEELDHLLLLAERAAARRSVSLFELELHANVTKHLVLSRFLARRAPRLDDSARLWLRRQLFEGSFCDERPAERRRYEDAVRWAVKFLDALGSFPPADRLQLLRRFHDADATGKLQLATMLSG